MFLKKRSPRLESELYGKHSHSELFIKVRLDDGLVFETRAGGCEVETVAGTGAWSPGPDVPHVGVEAEEPLADHSTPQAKVSARYRSTRA